MRNRFDQFVPGVYFQSEAPSRSSDLPRMDVAAFVGFAEKGPLDVPVAVETVKQFRDIFGADIDLAWDDKRNRFQQSLLGGSVESFFDNGGRRCVVVRVADRDGGNPAVVEPRLFEVPGLSLVGSGGPTAAILQARSPGAWSDTLRVAGQVDVTVLPLDFPGSAEAMFSRTAGVSQLRIKALPRRLARHDLLELSFDDIRLKACIFVEDILGDEFGPKVLSRDVYWLALPDLSIDPAAMPELLADEEGIARADALLGSTGQPDVSLRFLTLTLLVWQDGVLTGRMDDLAFHGAHPRFWQKLPLDHLLYGELFADRAPHLEPATAEFMLAAASPRFPLAGLYTRLQAQERQTETLRSLPLALKELAGLEDAVDALPLTSTARAMTNSQRNGLENLSAALFLDSSLAGIRHHSLQAEAEYKKIRYMELLQKREDGEWESSALERELDLFRLKGIHSLFFERDVSMIAVPDALHRAWNNDPPNFSQPLSAPQLEPLTHGAERNWIELTWRDVIGAMGYVIEQLIEPGNAEGVFYEVEGIDRLALGDSDSPPSSSLRSFRISAGDGCQKTHTFRLYAVGYDQRSPWSNARRMIVPLSDFYSCNKTEPSVLGLSLGFATGVEAGGGVALSWMAEDEFSQAEALADSFELQRALDIDFASANSTGIVASSGNVHVDDLTSDGVVYYRIRAVDNAVTGPWSNTIYVEPARLSKLQLVPQEDYQDSDMLAVHIALMRLCASRGDAVALLGLPEHFRDHQAIFATQALQPSLHVKNLGRRFGAGAVSVPALDASEAGTAQHAALFYPWLILSSLHAQPASQSTTDSRYSPSLGAVSGKLASVAVARGAWISAANKVFQEVLGTVANVPPFSFSNFAHQQINVISRDSRGVVAATMDTLGGGTEFRSLSERRLFDLLVRLIRREGVQHVFEPNSVDFRNRVHHFWDRVLNRLYQRGALRGRTSGEAYRVITDSSLNTPQAQDQGKFFVELRIAPSQPMRFIRVLLKQSNPDTIAVEEL